MRITNAMMTNTTLMHINRNMRNLDNIIRQIETTKRIQRPSDDPIIASRALQFRTSATENAQFRRNVDGAVAWMNVTEASMNNITRDLLRQIQELTVVGAHQTYNVSEMQTIITQISSLFEELHSAMNQTFAGQYVFSGFRTNEPPVFTAQNNRSFIITQNFNVADISREKAFQRLPSPDYDDLFYSRITDINVIRLPFTGLDTPPFTQVDGVFQPIDLVPENGIHVPGFHIRKISRTHEDAYRPLATVGDLEPPLDPTHPNYGQDDMPVLHFIYETGELVMHNQVASDFPREGVSVTYRKTGFAQGDINPAVFFTSREIVTDPASISTEAGQRIYEVTEYLSRASGEFDDTAGVYVFRMRHEMYQGFTGTGTGFLGTDLPSGLTPMLNGRPIPDGMAAMDGDYLTLSIPASFFLTNSNVSITYPVEAATPAAGRELMEDLSIQGARIVRALTVGGPTGVPIPLDRACFDFSFDMHNQDISFEFSTRTFVPVNTLAKNVLTDRLQADLKRLVQFSNEVTFTSAGELRQIFEDAGYSEEQIVQFMDEHSRYEYQAAREALYSQFNNMLFLINRHVENATREHTLLGSRMVRMELMQDRLEQDEVTFDRLVSDNESTDMIRALILRASAEAAFMGSLRANSGIVQMSLANFIG